MRMPPKILHHMHYMKRDLEILYQLCGDRIPVIVKTKSMVSYQALGNWFQYPAHTNNVGMCLVNVLEERFKVCMIVVRW